MKLTIKCLWFLGLLLLALPTSGLRAEEDATEQWSSNEEAKMRWSQMSEEDKQRVRENYQKWKGLSPEAQTQLKENFRRFSKLAPADKLRVVRRFQQFKKLPPERQQQVRERFQKFMKLSPQERQRRFQKIRERREGGGGQGMKKNIPQRMKNRSRLPNSPKRNQRGGGGRKK